MQNGYIIQVGRRICENEMLAKDELHGGNGERYIEKKLEACCIG